MRPVQVTPIALASMLLLQAAQAHAQKSDEDELSAIYGDKTTVSIATGNAQPLRRAPAVATVITAEDIAATGARELSEVLEMVPGLHASVDTQSYLQKIVIRGVGHGSPTNHHLLILQNGLRLQSSYSGDMGTPFKYIPVQNIARIEVIRGPGSALYGADAYAGVINIITKTASDTPGLELGSRLGSQNTREIWAQYGGKIGRVDTAIFVNAGHTDGVSETIEADAATRNDRLFGTKSSLAPGKTNNHLKNLDIGLDLSFEKFRFILLERLRDDLESGAGSTSALDPTGLLRSERFSALLNWSDKNFTKNLSLSTSVSYQFLKEKTPTGITLLPPGTRLPTGFFPNGVIGGPGRWERQLGFSAFANYTGFTNHQIRIGVGHDDLDLYKTETRKNNLQNAAGTPVPMGEVRDYSDIQPHIRPTRRKLNYLYLQDEWEFAKDWVLTAGVRHDRYSDFGRTTNPRFALVWDTTENLTTKLLRGCAFRAPSFNESFGINPVANGNPNLRPETVCTLEFATSWQASNNLQLNLNLYKFQRKSIIALIPNRAAGIGNIYANTGNQSGRGLEMEMGWDINRSLRLSGNYSYQKTTDGSTGQDAGYAPHHHLYGRLDWRFANGWQMTSQLNWVADRERTAGDTRPQIADYKTLDLTVRTTRGINHWDFSFSVRNLLNANAREPSLAPGLAIPNDLPLAGRTFLVQAIYKM